MTVQAGGLGREARVTTNGQLKRLVVAITGASGVDIGYELLRQAREVQLTTHLVISAAGMRTIREESRHAPADFRALASETHSNRDIGAAIASGSFETAGMIIAPCSMKTLAEIAHGIAGSLIVRAADVTLKERRPLVLAVRETPLHLGHLRNMTLVTEMGAIVAPPVPAFYQHPRDIDDLLAQTAARLLQMAGIPAPRLRGWPGESG
ncbi:MAG: UbiX family flavin prenyltransferase [Alphaproteobacteria bacterium]|nr:MAG: UbiX family flavin prenyltransferase [Alphaproteobacteria bacterium]